MVVTIASLEKQASLPPLRIQALPAFRQSEKTSRVTLGRASYTTPITPKGTATRDSCSPLGSTEPFSSLPTGDCRRATLRISAAIASTRSRVSFKRSYFGSSGDILARSRALASKIASLLFTTSSATAKIISFILSTPNLRIERDALFTSLKISSIAINFYSKYK